MLTWISNTMEAVLLVFGLIETLVLACLLVFFVAEAAIDFVIGKTRGPRSLSMIIQATLLEVRLRIGILSTKVTFWVMQNINSIEVWTSNLVTSVCLWVLEKQTCRAYDALEEAKGAVSYLPLDNEHRLKIPTTEIQGVLDTTAIHKAYHVLLSSSLIFRQVGPEMRSAMLSRIVYEIINYDEAVGHIWSLTNTFVLAAQIIQYQYFNADWFDKSFQLQLARTGTKFGDSASDIMATFISTVFLISCGFPTPGNSGASVTTFAKESTSMTREATTNTAYHNMGSLRPTSQRTRNSLSPGYSRQWHAAIRE